MKWWKTSRKRSLPAFIDSELAIAIVVFGVNSGKAFAAFMGSLVEIDVLISRLSMVLRFNAKCLTPVICRVCGMFNR